MKHTCWLLLLLLTPPAFGQGGNTVMIRFPGAPSGSCSPVAVATNNATGAFYNCLSAAWNLIGGASAPGTVTSVSGTTNQIDVATGTTTPVLTISSTLSIPGTFGTATNCAATGTSANPSVVTCSAAPTGSFACATNASTGTCQVNTTAVKTASRIFIQPTAAANTLTCNATSDTGLTAPRLLSQSNGASFTITLGTFTTTALCFNYWIVN